MKSLPKVNALFHTIEGRLWRYEMLRIFVVFFFCLFATQSQAGVTFKGGKISSGKSSELSALLKDLVTQERDASSLTDKELCDSLTALDLPSTFYEHEKRGLNCLAIRVPQENWKLPSRDQAFKYLKKYQSKYKVAIPKYSLNEPKPSFGSLEKTAELYEIMNPAFSDLYFNRGIDTGEKDEDITFCLDWFGNVSYIANDQSKTLDGSVSWEKGSLRDGFVLCQDRFNQIYLRSLIDKSMRSELEKMLLEWINNDRLRHDAEAKFDQFMPVLLFNKATVAIEMFHDSFGWNVEQRKKLSTWLERRALELFPTDIQPIATKCPPNHRSNDFYSYEACQNGGILAAQALLRVGIWNKDPEFIEMAYVAFHRYMSGIREDGSNITDASRGCTAADYNIWASQFMSDFLYQWDRISDPLWSKSFHEGVTPNQSVEYSLFLLGNFEAINKHTLDEKWKGCGEDKINKTQQATTRYGLSYYPRISFAPYFANKGKLLETLLDNDRLRDSAYTAQSGANYEIGLLARQPELEKEVREKINAKILARLNANIPTSIKELGFGKNANGELIVADPTGINIGKYSFKDYRPPKKAGYSERFRIKVQSVKSADFSVYSQTVSFYSTPGSLVVGTWAEDLFKKRPSLEAEWRPIYEKCGKIVDDSEFYWIEVPIKSTWQELNEQFECISENIESTNIQHLIGILVHAGTAIDFEVFRP